MIPDRVCARCGAARHTLEGVCPVCGYNGIATATDAEFSPVEPANPPSRCPYCGTVHAWGETNCRECGRRVYAVCRSCRAANAVGHRFCVYCGAGMVVGVSGQAASVFSLARWRPFSAAAELIKRTFPEASWSFLLPFGLLGIVAAQLVFGLGDSRELPGFGVFAILVGIAAIALWAATVGRSTISVGHADSAPDTNSTPRIVQSGKRYPKLIALGIGGVMSLVLLVRVTTGADNTWDVGLWLGSIAACASFFVPADYWSSGRWRPTKSLERAGGQWKRNWRGILPLLAILAIYCVLTVPNLTAWRYAALGDEYLFYEHARRALEMGTTNPFGQNGVYDNNPEFNTLYKAGWMALFGDGHFGWKMTGVASMVLAISGMYALGGVLGGRATAVAAAGFLAASHYLFGLLNGGYNHLDALPVTIWTMVAFVLGLQKRTSWFLFLAGIGVGIGFYFHYSARIVGPVMLLVAMVSVSPREYLRLWPVIAGFLLAAWPTLLIARAEILTKMLAQTAAGYSEVVVGSVSERLISNVKLNLSAFHFNTASHTYVGGPLLDRITGALAAVGIGVAIGNPSSLAARLCLIWIGVAFLATGLTSPYPTTAITRLFPIVLPLALLAGLATAAGYRLLMSQLPRLQTDATRVAGPIALIVVLGSVLWLNQHRALVGTHEVFHYTGEALAVGASRSAHCGPHAEQTVFVGAHPESTLSKAVSSYEPGMSRATVIPFAEFQAAEPLARPACVIIAESENSEAQRIMMELQERYPSGTFYTYTTPSRKSSVEYFHIPQT